MEFFLYFWLESGTWQVQNIILGFGQILSIIVQIWWREGIWRLYRHGSYLDCFYTNISSMSVNIILGDGKMLDFGQIAPD